MRKAKRLRLVDSGCVYGAKPEPHMPCDEAYYSDHYTYNFKSTRRAHRRPGVPSRATLAQLKKIPGVRYTGRSGRCLVSINTGARGGYDWKVVKYGRGRTFDSGSGCMTLALARKHAKGALRQCWKLP